MKKAAFQISQIFALLILFNSVAVAQDKFPQLRTKIDRIFARLDQNQFKSLGIVEEYSLGFMNLSQVNTTNTMPKDSLHYINSIVWRMTYATLQSGKIPNSTAAGVPMPDLSEVNQSVEQYRLANPTHNPIMLLHADYYSIDSNAVRDNLFTVRNGQLYDVPTRTRSPYKNHTIKMAAADVIEDTDGEVTFVFPYNLAFDNLSFAGSSFWSGAISIESDGNIQNLTASAFNKPFTFRYATRGMKEVKMTFKSFSKLIPPTVLSFYIKILHTNFGVSARTGGKDENGLQNIAQSERYSDALGNQFNIPARLVNILGQTLHAGCKLQTRLSTNNTAIQPTGDIRFQKPLIVLEGYDGHNVAPLLVRENTSISDFLGDQRTYQNISKITSYDLNDELDMANYDIIYVDYNNGSDDITRNSALLQDVLRWVNARKVNNAAGVREQNVVMGMSMGGLVGRYGLAEMEKNRRAGIPNNDHETRLLVTHDSPHRGANFPLALQSLIETARPLLWVWQIHPIFRQLADFANTPANKQLGIYQTVPVGALLLGNILYQKNTWIADVYKPMVSFPANNRPPYREVAMSNASECGTSLYNPYSHLLTHQISGFIAPIPWLVNAKWKAGISLRGLPDRQRKQIFNLGLNYELSLFGGFITINTQVVGAKGFSHDDMLPLDGIAGGTNSFSLRKLGFGDNAIDLSSPSWFPFAGFEILSSSKERHSFIPKYSALDINLDISADELVSSKLHATEVAKTSFDAIFVAPTSGGFTGVSGSQFNQPHIAFNATNAEFMFSQMELGNANSTLPILDCSAAFCNPNTITINSSLPSLCFGATPNIFSVSNLPTPAVVTWTANNNLVTIATPNAVSTVITPVSATSRGFVTITADISAPECNAFTRRVTKRIWVGNMQTMTGFQSTLTTPNACEKTFRYVANNTAGGQRFTYIYNLGLSDEASNDGYFDVTVLYGQCLDFTLTVNAVGFCGDTQQITRSLRTCSPTTPPGEAPCMARIGQPIANPKLNIFPNPTSAILNLEFENLPAKVTSICVMNMLGLKVLCAENIQLSADNKTNLDLSKLPEGIYILQVVYENGTTTSQKIVVQRGVIAN